MPTAWFNDQFHDFESAFQSQLEAIHAPNRLKEAILYSTLNGGKRLRALLTLASGELCGADRETLYPIAGAIECIHAYSLIHDDLPAMDDDDFRRGKPTCHKAFDEATAILAGDALLTLSFELLSQVPNLSAEKKLEIIQLYSFSAGTQGMVGGQFIDLESEDKTSSFYATSFFIIKDNLINEITEYWGDNGEPPEWRLNESLSERY